MTLQSTISEIHRRVKHATLGQNVLLDSEVADALTSLEPIKNKVQYISLKSLFDNKTVIFGIKKHTGLRGTSYFIKKSVIQTI